ncbi:aspartyl-phosphate phosphatase Spo0E family protein [Priestia megaterium]|nr:aspartyl-phosphate phosphatase Spo0E family protein [Priestia megaterium]
MTCKDGLLTQIEEYRNYMITLANETSLSSSQVLKASIKLDGLLNEYEKHLSM